MQLERLEVSIAVDASGDGTGYTDQIVSGRVLGIRYVPDGSIPYATGVDIVVTGAVSGIAILTKANLGTSGLDMYPRAPLSAVADGSALLYAAGGTAVVDAVPVAGERIKIVVAQGGVSKTGKFHLFIG